MSTRVFAIDTATRLPVQEDGVINFKVVNKESGEIELAPDKEVGIFNTLVAILNPAHSQLEDAEFTIEEARGN